MKKALIVANLGGFVEFLYDDIKLLKKYGYDVTYAANTDVAFEKVHRNNLKKLKVRVVDICFDSKKPLSKRNMIACKQIKELLKENFELIHCHTPIVGVITKILANRYRKRNSKVIYTTHGFAFNKYSSRKSWLLYYTLEKFTSRFCDAIITINREDYCNAKKMHCKNIFYIHGVGVNIEKYTNIKLDVNRYKKENGIPTDKTIILSIGELSTRKNHSIIISALSTLKNKEDYVYVICGRGIEGGTGPFLEEYAKKMGVHLILKGYRTDIPQMIQCSDIGALPSIREGLGLAGIQSLAAGVPLVATDVQGIKDYVIEGKTGCLCNPNDCLSVANAIVKLSDPILRKRMKNNCKEIAKNFDMIVSSKEREEIYMFILNKMGEKL